MKVIFIGAVPRSGTTFLANQLARHSDCVVLPEAHFKYDLLVNNGVSRAYKWEEDIYKKYVRADIFDDSTSLNDFYVRIANSTGKSLIIDHTPDNFRYYHLLKEGLPSFEVCFLGLLRNPVETMTSVLKLDWGPSDIYDACAWYQRSIASCLPSVFLEDKVGELIRYENLVSDSDFECIRVLKNFGITPGGGKSIVITPDYTKKQHAKVSGTVDKGASERLKSSLSCRDQRIINFHLSSIIYALGYTPTGGYATTDESRQTAKQRLYGVYLKLLDRIRLKLRRRNGVV